MHEWVRGAWSGWRRRILGYCMEELVMRTAPVIELHVATDLSAMNLLLCQPSVAGSRRLCHADLRAKAGLLQFLLSNESFTIKAMPPLY